MSHEVLGRCVNDLIIISNFSMVNIAFPKHTGRLQAVNTDVNHQR